MMHSYGSDDEDYDTFSMGSDDMEKFGRSNDDEDEAVEREDDRYETYEMSSGDEFSVDDGEDDCVVDDSMITSYEDFQASRTKDDEDEPFFDESNQEEMDDYEDGRDNDRQYDEHEDHLYSTHILADNGEWLQKLSRNELDAFGLEDDCVRQILYRIQRSECDCEGCYYIIKGLMMLKSNSPELKGFLLFPDYASDFNDFGWRLLGSYIGSHTHLKRISMEGVELTEGIISLLSAGLQRNCSVENIDFGDTSVGINELRCLVPILRASTNVYSLDFGGNPMIKCEGLEIILSSMTSTALREIHFISCNVERIGIIRLPKQLRSLTLDGNLIKTAGCNDLARLLRRDDCRLVTLSLLFCDLDDEAASILANALRVNKSMSIINLQCNDDITEEGHKSFLSTVNDMSSIQNTLASNHTLTQVLFGNHFEELDDFGVKLVDIMSGVEKHLNDALETNLIHGCEEAGRKKVINTQLNIHKRDELSRLQGLSKPSLFPDCPIYLLPEILSLIGTNHRLSEMYPVVNASISTLMSMTRSQGSAGNTQPKRTRKRRHEVLRQRIDGRGYIM